ncbi:putative KAT8 regulatory NSL complex subunit 3/Testis-expressed sequence 30 protein [Helianthus annuus]|nr:putative KAT8 regulatory NSL complex subunit 3/Testis-expressed sequence 30 protein [Helianthus annuus]
MDSKSPKTTENELEQHDPMIKTAETSSVKCSDRFPPVVVFAHGSGGPSTSEWMIRWRNLLATALNAVEVVTFDYPYIHGARKAAPKPETLVGFHSDVVRKVAAKYPEHPLILAGKSMGSRVSCMVAAEKDIVASAVVCLGYPLKGRTGVIHKAPLLQLTVPIMFVQGSNDFHCPLQLLEVVMSKLKALNALHVIQHGDHSFQISEKNLKCGMTREKTEECAAAAVAEFVSQITSETVINGPRDTTRLFLQASPKFIPPQHVSRKETLTAGGDQNSQRIESHQPKVKKINSAKQKPTQNARKRKSERILKNKLKKCVYVKDGRGSTVDNPLNLD